MSKTSISLVGLPLSKARHRFAARSSLGETNLTKMPHAQGLGRVSERSVFSNISNIKTMLNHCARFGCNRESSATDIAVPAFRRLQSILAGVFVCSFCANRSPPPLKPGPVGFLRIPTAVETNGPSAIMKNLDVRRHSGGHNEFPRAAESRTVI
jgi:hypothetical protein